MAEDTKAFPADSPLGRARMIDPTVTPSDERKFIQLKLDTNDISYVLTQLQALRFRAYNRNLVLPVIQCTKLTDDNETYVCETGNRFIDPECKGAVWLWSTVLEASDLEYTGLIMHIDDGDAKVHVTQVGQMVGDEVTWFKCGNDQQSNNEKGDDLIVETDNSFRQISVPTMVIHFKADELSTNRIVTYLGGLVFYVAPTNSAPTASAVNISVRRVTKLEDGVIKCELDDFLNNLPAVTLTKFTFRTQVDVKYQLVEAYYEDGTLKGMISVYKADQTGETASDEKLQKWAEQRERQHLLSSSKLGISFIIYVDYYQASTFATFMTDNVIGLVFEQDGKDNYVALRSFTRCDDDSVFRAAPYDSPNLEPFLDCCKTKQFPMKLTGLVFRNDGADKWDPEFYYKITRADIVYVDFSTPYAGGYQTDRISLDVAPAMKRKRGCEDHQTETWKVNGHDTGIPLDRDREEHQALFGRLEEDLDKKMRIMFLVEDKGTDSPNTIDVRQKEREGALLTAYRIEAKGQTDRYEVRGVSVLEFTKGGHVLLQSKRCDYIKGLDMELVRASSNILGDPAQPRKVCSDLVVKQGVTVSDVEIFHGGSVTVEEGGTIRDVKVYPGGELEFCKGAKAIDVYALGGHIYGDDLKCKYASVVLSGVELDTSASFEEGVYIKGLITSGYLAVGAGAHLKDVKVKKGGYVSLFGRSVVEGLSIDTDATVTLFPDCTVHHLVAEVGATVRIFSGARIFEGDIKGIVYMNVPKEEDLKHDNRFVDVTFSEAGWFEQMESLDDEDNDDE